MPKNKRVIVPFRQFSLMCMKTSNRFFIAFLLLLISFPAVYGSSFGSFLGTSAELVSEDSDAALKLNGVFALQYSVDENLLFRGDFRVRTGNIFSGGFFQDTQGFFSVKELAVVYRFPAENTTQQASFFFRDVEGIGSDLFLSRHLGVNNFASPVLTPMADYSSVSIYNYSGFGASYVVKLPTANVFGLSMNYSGGDNTLISGDFRYAGIYDNLIIDSSLGLSLPYSNQDASGNDVLLLIEHMNLHFGVSALWGKSRHNSFFAQLGLRSFQLHPIDFSLLTSDDLYFFFEPRIVGQTLNFNASIFNIPKAAAKDLVFFSKSLGVNLLLSVSQFLFLGSTAEAGVGLSLSTDGFKGLADFMAYDLQLTPYVNYKLFGGSLSMVLKIHPLDLFDLSKFGSFSIGYKLIM